MHEPYWALRGQKIKKESERNAAVVEETQQQLRRLLQYLEEALGEKPYFLGELSLTDIDLLPRFLRMESYGAIPTPSLPRINAWLQRMKERPSVKAIL
jgi:glutathione S-transferase